MRTMRWMLLLAAIIASTVACTSSRGYTATELVPADAVGWLAASWQDVRSDSLLRQFSAVPPRAAKLLDEVGVSLDDANTVVSFSSSLDAADAGDGMIVSSRLVVQHFLTAIRQRGEASKSSTPFAIYQGSGPSDVVATALSSDVLVLGRRDTVLKVVSVAQGQGASFARRSDLRELDRVFQASDPVRMAVAWPTEVRDAAAALFAGSAGLLKLGGLGAVGGLVQQFGIGRAVGMSCARAAGGLRCKVTGILQDEATAALIAGGASLLKGLAGMVPQSAMSNEGVRTPDLTVERRGAAVTVGVTVQ